MTLDKMHAALHGQLMSDIARLRDAYNENPDKRQAISAFTGTAMNNLHTSMIAYMSSLPAIDATSQIGPVPLKISTPQWPEPADDKYVFWLEQCLAREQIVTRAVIANHAAHGHPDQIMPQIGIYGVHAAVLVKLSKGLLDQLDIKRGPPEPAPVQQAPAPMPPAPPPSRQPPRPGIVPI